MAGGHCLIKNIVLDMGNVLIRFDPELFLSRYVLTEEQRKMLLEQVFRSVEWVMLDRGTLDEAGAEQRILPRLPEPLHAVAQDLIEAWDEPLIPVRGMLELVRQLKQQGYQLYLLSNAAARQPLYWARTEASRLMDGALISAQVGLLKPVLESINLLRRFALCAEECVFIDDTAHQGGSRQQEGMAGILFRQDPDSCAKTCEHTVSGSELAFCWRSRIRRLLPLSGRVSPAVGHTLP